MHPSARAGGTSCLLNGLVVSVTCLLLSPACSIGEITDPSSDNDGGGDGGSGGDGSGGDDLGGGGGDDGGDGDGGDRGGNLGDENELVPEHPTEGSVLVTLHPVAADSGTQVVSFGAPFPPGALPDVGALRAFDEGGAELPIHAGSILPWRVFPGRQDGTESVRSAMVSIEVSITALEPMTIELEYGAAPSATLPAPGDPRASWVAVTDGEYPAGLVREPRVYATFPTDWLSASLLRTRTTPIGSDPTWGWLDQSTVGSAHTAVNDVPDAVTELIDYTGDAEAWLFDRTATLFNVYARTGDVKWLRHAHRSAQFYLSHLTANGYFDLKEGEDLKYSYGRSLLIDLVFTGDPAMLDGIDRIASAGVDWDPTYDLETNFWTERHQTYALLAALAAWEATGAAAHADRARQIAGVSFALATDPVGSWPDNDCMLHGMTAHEGAGGDVPICSPWMSALFADAVWEYYIHTRDDAALEFLAGLGQFVKDHGLYVGGDSVDMVVPWYLSSSEMQFSDDGPWGDLEHTCDVAGLVARGAWARRALGGDPEPLRATAESLLEGCVYNLEMWHRPAGPDSGQSEWRLSPSRKFNWWFGTTSDLTWIFASLDR